MDYKMLRESPVHNKFRDNKYLMIQYSKKNSDFSIDLINTQSIEMICPNFMGINNIIAKYLKVSMQHTKYIANEKDKRNKLLTSILITLYPLLHNR